MNEAEWAQLVQPFLYELGQRPQIQLVHKEVVNKELCFQDEVCIQCYVHHQPNRRLRFVRVETTDGVVIKIPVLDLIRVEIEEGKALYVGRVFDPFA